MTQQPTTEQLLSLCAKAHLLAVVYRSMRQLLEANGSEKLKQEFERNPIYRIAPKPSIANVRNEGKPDPLPQFEMSRFVNPDSSDVTFQALADAIEYINVRLKYVLMFYNRNRQTFDQVAFEQLPLENYPDLSDHVDLADKIANYTKLCNDLRKLFLAH